MKKRNIYYLFIGIIFFTIQCAQGPVADSGTGTHIDNPAAKDLIVVKEYQLDQPFNGKEIAFGDGPQHFHQFQRRNIHRGRSIPVRIEIENKSDENIALEKIYITGLDANHFVVEDSSLLHRLKPHHKTYFDLYFAPKQVGEKRAQVEFYATADRDQSPRYFFFTISGMGTNRNMYVSPLGNDNNLGDASHPKKTIQNAVDTLAQQVNLEDPIDTILLETGEYYEQVVIQSSMGIVGDPDAKHRTVIRAPDPLKRIPNADGQKDVVAIVGDGDSRNIKVELAFLSVRGSVSGQDGCQPLEQGGNILSGIRVRDSAFAYLHDNLITNIRANEMQGCQNGIGILLGHSRHESRLSQRTPGFAVVLGNEVEDYQKAGIVSIGKGSVATILNNVVQGYKLRPQIAQNGIQMSLGSSGLIEGNFVSGNQCEQNIAQDPLHPDLKCGADPYKNWQASGILLSEYTDKIVVRGNLVTENDLGFSTQIAGTPVTNQEVVSVEDNFFIDNRRVNVYIEQSKILLTRNQISSFSQVSPTPWGTLLITDQARLEQKVMFLRNDIFQNGVGLEVGDGDPILLDPQANPVVTLLENNIFGNKTGAGVKNLSNRFVDARNNYWGHSSGPSAILGSMASGNGDSVSSHVRFAPFAQTKFVILDTP